ncbi:MAG: hypothetical protein HYY04_17475 [Chloroflexi bacterium]|nr:hypothetical protein [Chloroflexota bacterium]
MWLALGVLAVGLLLEQPHAAPTPATIAVAPVTKLGIGLARESDAALQALVRMRPAVLLMVDPSPSFTWAAREALPDTLFIGRRSVEDELSSAGGARFAGAVLEQHARLGGVIDAWTFYNEVPVQTPEARRAFDQAQVAFARQLRASGARVVGFNFHPGAVEPEAYATDFPTSLPLVDYVGVHAYGSERFFFLNAPDAPWHALRYRAIYDALAHGGQARPIVLTETGTFLGWKRWAAVDRAVADFLWLEAEIERDAYVVGQAPFVLDGWNWDDYRLLETSAVEGFARHNAGKRIVARSPPSPPTPLPVGEG